MNKQQAMKTAIQSVIKAMMERVMDNVLVKDPFVVETHQTKRPLYAALVPDEIFKGSHFERRFVTPFGKAWETLAIVRLGKAWDTAKREKKSEEQSMPNSCVAFRKFSTGLSTQKKGKCVRGLIGTANCNMC